MADEMMAISTDTGKKLRIEIEWDGTNLNVNAPSDNMQVFLMLDMAKNAIVEEMKKGVKLVRPMAAPAGGLSGIRQRFGFTR